MKIFEAYTGDGEKTTVFFDREEAAIEWAKNQILDDQYTVVSFDYSGGVLDALNGTGKQTNRTIILDVRK